MNRVHFCRQSSAHGQSGSTLIVALVLILLASLLAVFAMNVGIFSQRTSASDLRARVVQQTLEAALSQGVEYIKANRSIIDTTNATLWKLCGATDTDFPCGAVPQFAADGVTPRRGTMYYYIGGAGYDVNGNGSTTDNLDARSLPLGSRLTTVNGFPVNYGVGAMMCALSTTITPATCTTATTNLSNTYAFTLIAVGNIQGESSNTTLSTSFGTNPIVRSAVNTPPITASGVIDITGTGQFVTNPDAGGTGVPVTMWTRQGVDKHGTPNTCYYEDYIRGGSPSFAINSDGSTSNLAVCNSCSCSNSISYQSSGNNSGQAGIDILSNDSGAYPIAGTSACTAALAASGSCKSNYDVQPGEFPCDLFQFVFGVQAWEDDTGTQPSINPYNCAHDCFCETKKTTTYKVANGTSQVMGVDEAYLYQNATQIIPTSAHTAWVTAAQLATCTALSDSGTQNKAKGGLIWDQTGSCSAGQIGFPDLPVVLVADGGTTFTARVTMYGLLFGRATGSTLDPATGGDAQLALHGQAVIYGSVVVQGQVNKFNGTSAIVSLPSALRSLSIESALNPAAPIAGSWTDRFSY